MKTDRLICALLTLCTVETFDIRKYYFKSKKFTPLLPLPYFPSPLFPSSHSPSPVLYPPFRSHLLLSPTSPILTSHTHQHVRKLPHAYVSSLTFLLSHHLAHSSYTPSYIALLLHSLSQSLLSIIPTPPLLLL